MKLPARIRVGIWLGFLVACSIIVAKSQYGADLAAFLPSSPSPTQRFLVDELREGVVSRLILIGIEGGEEDKLATLSRSLAERLEKNERFTYVANGAQDALRADGEFLLRNRYVLSPAVTAERFGVAGIRRGLEQQLDLLSSPTSLLVGNLLPRDPTGEMLQLIDRLQGQGGPDKRDGIWFSADGTRALLVAQTRAAGFDIDAQEQALVQIRAAFQDALAQQPAEGARMVFTGPGVFAVESRAGIQRDAMRFSLLGTLLVSAILLFVYRSLRVLALTLVPVASGALAGIAAVSLAFGSVHGVTLGFGATLIGEAVDYAIYLFSNTAPGGTPNTTLQRIWPTLRLGMLTSVFGFGAMLFSGFPGLSQLGLFSIAGLVVAGSVTRWVLPELVPQDYHVRTAAGLGPSLMRLLAQAQRLRVPLLIVVMVVVAWLAIRGATVWDDELSSLSPVPLQLQRLDQQMRTDLGAPDVGPVVVVRGDSERHPVHRAECKADRRDAGHRAARYRHQRQRQHSQGPIDEQQGRADQQRPEQGKAHRIALDAGAALHRKDARSGDDEPCSLGVLFRHRGLEGGANLRQRLFLRIDVEAGRARLRNQQRAGTVGGKPDAVALVRSALALQSVDQLQHLPGRVARQQIACQHAGR